jgi:hypothetical protein
MTATIWDWSARAAEPETASVVDGVELAAGSTAVTFVPVVALAAAPAAEVVGVADPHAAAIKAAARDAAGRSMRRAGRRWVEIIVTSCGPSSSELAAS